MSYYTRFSAAVSLDAHILYDIHTSLIAQSEIRAMTLECARIGGINLAQGVCDTELPLPVGQGAKEAIDAGINSYTRRCYSPNKGDND